MSTVSGARRISSSVYVGEIGHVCFPALLVDDGIGTIVSYDPDPRDPRLDDQVQFVSIDPEKTDGAAIAAEIVRFAKHIRRVDGSDGAVVVFSREGFSHTAAAAIAFAIALDRITAKTALSGFRNAVTSGARATPNGHKIIHDTERIVLNVFGSELIVTPDGCLAPSPHEE